MTDNIPDFKLMGYDIFASPKYTEIHKTEDGRMVNGYFMMIGDKQGIFLKTSEGKCRIMLGNEFEPYLYRGENQKYDYFQPSLERERLKGDYEYCIAWIRANQFKRAFQQTPYYRLQEIKVVDCSFEFDLEALAQHYEFKTNYIDLTKDREVAEFFAYTYIDENGNYQPITDFEKYHPHLYRAKVSDIMTYNKDLFAIVGFQAALRPLKQTAMALNLSNGNKTIRDDIFEEVPLETDTDLAKKKAQEIFDKFEHGKKLFPDKVLKTLEDELKKEDAFVSEISIIDYAATFRKSAGAVKSMLRHKGHKIKDSILYPCLNLREKMQHDVDYEIVPWIETNIGHRRSARMYGQ